MSKSLGLFGTAMALCLASTSSMAFQHYGPPGPPPPPPPHHAPPPPHHGPPPPMYHGRGFYDRGRHEGWYRRGGYVPTEYRRGSYVVTDWRSRRLHEPPRGYEYVRSDNGDYLLVAIATGVIVNILAGY